MKNLIHACLELVRPQFRLNINHGWHGISHWSRVWVNGRELCEKMELDPTVPCAFAYLHDSQRFDEGSDIMHGARACEWLDSLYQSGRLGPLNLDYRHYKLLVRAIEGHSFGETDEHPLVQICWDSDRLDLGRVGIIPDPQYLCTEAAKDPAQIEKSYQRSINL